MKIKPTTNIYSAVILSFIFMMLYYFPFANNFFAYDSFRYIENLFSGPYKVMLGYNAFRVVSNFMWYPLFYISGFEPSGYAIFNCFLHLLNSILLYILTYKLFDNKKLSFLISIIFTINTTACDALFWHMSMSTLLCSFFYLCSLFSYITYKKNNKNIFLYISFIIYFIAMFTKEDAASLPIVILSIEIIFYGGLNNIYSKFKATVPYCFIIIFYITTSNIVFKFFGVIPETSKFFKFRPLYSLFGGFSAFIINPNGYLDLSINNFILVFTVIFLIFYLYLTKYRKIIIFSYMWIILTFLPQSLSLIGQFEPKYIFNSVSRLLYLPIIGVSITISILILELSSFFRPLTGFIISSLIITLFFAHNYERVKVRGTQWQQEAEPVKIFLQAMKFNFPYIPPNTYIFVIDPPTGRAYVQQALRAFYKNPSITWIADPQNFSPPSGSLALLFVCNWSYGMKAVTINSMAFNQNIFKN